jgi:hypothetical protein
MSSLRVGVAVDPNIVGRIQKGRIDRSIVANDLAKEVEVATIAATNAVLATNPDIAGICAGLDRNGRNRLVVRVALRRQQDVDLTGRKPCERKVEIDLEVGKLLELQLQKISVPACVERNLIIRKAQRAPLGLVEMRQRNGRRQVEADRLGREQPAMPGDYDAVDIDEQRIGESKLPNGSGDFGNLFLRMRSRIPRFRLDAVRWPINNGQVQRRLCRLFDAHEEIIA